MYASEDILLYKIGLRGKLRAPEAANYLGLSLSTINKLRSYGGGPSFLKHNRRVAYDVSDLDARADSRKGDSTSSPSSDSANRDAAPAALLAARRATP